MTDLNQYGAACRCLLRLRENEGQPNLSDAEFIARFLPNHPTWLERPGETDATTLLEVARELGLAERLEVSSGFDRVLQEHRAGRGILVTTECAPEQRESPAPRPSVLLLVAADEAGFTVWCPYPSGLSDVLPRAARVWWERWQARGIVLTPPAGLS